MHSFDAPVSVHMSAAAHTVGPEARLPEVERLLVHSAFSGIPVVDDKLQPLGVITRTDLLRVGAVSAVTGTSRTKLVVPDRRVGDVIHGEPLCVSHGAPLEEAARIMREHHVHRVLVVSGRRLVGIVTSWDVVRAIAEARVALPIGRMMSSPVLTVPPTLSTGMALAQLAKAHVRALVVVESGWPVGVFAQREALVAERWPSRTQVDRWLDPALLTLPPNFPAYRAAAQAIATGTRTITVMDLEGVCGIVTATNFLFVTPNAALDATESASAASSRPPLPERSTKPNERLTAPAMPAARRRANSAS